MRRFELTVDDRATGIAVRRVLIRYAMSFDAARGAVSSEGRTVVSMRELGPVESEQQTEHEFNPEHARRRS